MAVNTNTTKIRLWSKIWQYFRFVWFRRIRTPSLIARAVASAMSVTRFRGRAHHLLMATYPHELGLWNPAEGLRASQQINIYAAQGGKQDPDENDTT
jgi:hypothetical protein